MKYLHKFTSLTAFNAAYNGQDYIEPWVSYTVDSNLEQVNYNKENVPQIEYYFKLIDNYENEWESDDSHEIWIESVNIARNPWFTIDTNETVSGLTGYNPSGTIEYRIIDPEQATEEDEGVIYTENLSYSFTLDRTDGVALTGSISYPHVLPEGDYQYASMDNILVDIGCASGNEYEIFMIPTFSEE